MQRLEKISIIMALDMENDIIIIIIIIIIIETWK